MAKSTLSDIKKVKRIGRPPVGAIPVLVRIPPAEMQPIDDWISKNNAQSRPEAIRRLVEIGLKTAPPTIEQINEAKSHAAQAAKLAAELGLKAKKK
jgi:hypothetical protein